MNDREAFKREVAALADRTAPADIDALMLPESFESNDRLLFAKGIAALRTGDFYLAHDLWEEVWQGYRGTDRRFLQGLIHVAVGCYHAACKNPKGAKSQFGKATAKIAPFGPAHWGIDAARLLALVESARAEDVHSPQMANRLEAVRGGL